MKRLLENQKIVNLMIWETDHKKRNINNEIKLNIKENESLNIGDVIITKYNAEGSTCSSYEILEIKERRTSSLKSNHYITALTKWKNKPLDFKGFDFTNTSESFKNVFDLID